MITSATSFPLLDMQGVCTALIAWAFVKRYHFVSVSQDFGNFVLVHLERFEVRCQEIPTSRFDWNTALFEASADRPGRESPSHFLSAIISVSHTLQLHVSKAPPCQTQAAKTEMETQGMLS